MCFAWRRGAFPLQKQSVENVRLRAMEKERQISLSVPLPPHPRSPRSRRELHSSRHFSSKSLSRSLRWRSVSRLPFSLCFSPPLVFSPFCPLRLSGAAPPPRRAAPCRRAASSSLRKRYGRRRRRRRLQRTLSKTHPFSRSTLQFLSRCSRSAPASMLRSLIRHAAPPRVPFILFSSSAVSETVTMSVPFPYDLQVPRCLALDSC